MHCCTTHRPSLWANIGSLRPNHAPLWANQNTPPLVPTTQDPQPAPATHPELKPLACSQVRTSEASERGLSCGSGTRGPGTVRLGPERPWARRACSSSLTLSIWQNFSADGKQEGGTDSGRRVLIIGRSASTLSEPRFPCLEGEGRHRSPGWGGVPPPLTLLAGV